MKIKTWFKTWGSLLAAGIALGALGTSICAIYLDSMHFEESKKLQQQQFGETSEIAQRALSLSENQSENERVYKKIVMLNEMIKDTEGWIQSWRAHGGDTRDLEDNWKVAKSLSANATVAWNDKKYGEADILIGKAYDSLAEIPMPPGAVPLTINALTITPTKVNSGEIVTISAIVTNTGDLSGTYEVALKINNAAVETKTITLASGVSQAVTFTTSKDIAGTYTVDVNGLSDTFTVTEPIAHVRTPTPWWGWLIVGLAVVAVIGVIVWLVVIRPRFWIFFADGRIVIRPKE